jgi:predicted transposase YbfD/YdcC
VILKEEKMQILLQFYIFNKIKHESFLFWSCVLDSCLDETNIDFKYLNEKNKINIESFDDFALQIEYKSFTRETFDSNYKNYCSDRPEIFLATDATMQRGSPYSHASSLMKIYYQIPSDFISNLTKFCNLRSDYKFTQFQLNIISIIKKEFGIDILRNESIPGCLSVYTRMPGFSVNGNFNALNGIRYITIFPEKNIPNDNVLVEIEVTDRKKILFKKLCKYTSDFRYEFPQITELEHFSEFRVSIYFFFFSDGDFNKIFEECFHLLRSFNISGSIGGRNSKIVKNRFLEKSADKIDIMQHQPFASTSGKKDWVDWEIEYKDVLLGPNKKYLDSMFFSRETGRKLFLEWARKTVSRGQRVTIVDPFFDENGLRDFDACIDTHLKVRILMLDPQNMKIKTNDLLDAIYALLPGAEVYIVDHIHDRYLIVEEDTRTVVYSLSNSWNGTVNNYSLFVQEVPLLPALEIEEEIEKYIKNENLQINRNINNPKHILNERDRSIYTESFIKDFSEHLNAVTDNSDPDIFIQISTELFWAYYYGKVDKPALISQITEKLMILKKDTLSTLVTKITVKLFENQKETFVLNSKFINNEPFSYYDSPEKCIERISPGNFFGRNYFDLDLDYALYELLKTIFYLWPKMVINEITEKENELCVVYRNEKDEKIPLKYFVSELIISSYLAGKYPAELPIEEDILDFISKSKIFMYCRIFFALAIMYHDRKVRLTFNEIIEHLNVLGLEHRELLILLADMYCKFFIQKRNQHDADNIDVLLNDIVKFVLDRYSNRDITTFAYKAYIEPYDLNFNELKHFTEQLEFLERNNEKQEVQKLFLLSASQTNTKLQNKIKEIINPNDYILNGIVQPLENKKSSAIDAAKYNNFIPYLGYLLASFIESDTQMEKAKNIQFSLSTDKALIFLLYKFPENMGLFYYDLALLLSTVFLMTARVQSRSAINKDR